MDTSESIETMPCNRGRKRKPGAESTTTVSLPWTIVTQGIRLVLVRYEKEETR
jgi:hypothetical protein